MSRDVRPCMVVGQQQATGRRLGCILLDHHLGKHRDILLGEWEETKTLKFEVQFDENMSGMRMVFSAPVDAVSLDAQTACELAARILSYFSAKPKQLPPAPPTTADPIGPKKG